MRLLVEGARQTFPDLLLARVILGDGEGHQLLEGHLLGDIEIE